MAKYLGLLISLASTAAVFEPRKYARGTRILPGRCGLMNSIPEDSQRLISSFLTAELTFRVLICDRCFNSFLRRVAESALLESRDAAASFFWACDEKKIGACLSRGVIESFWYALISGEKVQDKLQLILTQLRGVAKQYLSFREEVLSWVDSDGLLVLDKGGFDRGYPALGLLASADLIRILHLNGDPLQTYDLTPVSGLVNLEELFVYETPVQDLQPLGSLVNLRLLQLNDMEVCDLRPLSNLSRLETLCLGETTVSDITPLSNLVSLHSLCLYNTVVSDVSPLSGLMNLRFLCLTRAPVEDIRALNYLQQQGLEIDW